MHSRRSFLKQTSCIASGLCFGGLNALAYAPAGGYEARYYSNIGRNAVQCLLCFRSCTIPNGDRGYCRVRENNDGTLHSVVYARPAALQLDPIEKEPMFHNIPGSNILCIGTASCNFRCQFCHNWHLTQRSPEELRGRTQHLYPEEIVAAAKERGMGMSFTYNEPTIFYEYMYDIAELGQREGLNVIFHTNGGMQEKPLRRLLEHMTAVTVDLKGFTADFYQDVSFADMEPVIQTLKTLKEEGVWFEIVNLIIPTLNDNTRTIREMCKWIVNELGVDVPVHFTRFSPAYKMTHLQPTPVRTLERARDIALDESIKFVYIGNVPGHKNNSTFCPRCDERIIQRRHFSVLDLKIKDGKCENCGENIPGKWS